jgi:hypothetical protein
MFSTTTVVILGVLLLIAAAIYYYLRFIIESGNLLGANAILAHTAQHNRQMQESIIRSNRASKLRNLERDLEHAEELMGLEQRAHQLREQYQRGGQDGRPYSPELEELFRKVREDIERMKRG